MNKETIDDITWVDTLKEKKEILEARKVLRNREQQKEAKKKEPKVIFQSYIDSTKSIVCIEITVLNSFTVKDKLKARGYKFGKIELEDSRDWIPEYQKETKEVGCWKKVLKNVKSDTKINSQEFDWLKKQGWSTVTNPQLCIKNLTDGA